MICINRIIAIIVCHIIIISIGIRLVVIWMIMIFLCN